MMPTALYSAAGAILAARGTNVRALTGGAANRVGEWKSKVIAPGHLTKFAWGRLSGPGLSMHMTMAYDGVTAFDDDVSTGPQFRLPAGRPRTIEITLESDEAFTSLIVASSIEGTMQ
jgi:hypothetical protein